MTPGELITYDETKALILRLLTRCGGEASEDTIRYYLVLTREVRMMQGILEMLEAGEMEAERIDGHKGDFPDDYRIRLTKKES